ncbi:hypothetical protein FJ434_11715 [Mesorhizobium sp. B2-5-13]|uniref:hypothetical protein n=1 Tax=unclassified Mesorhizobium TaxID=325217 RepID=UPI001127786E|nr:MULTISPECIES: hypothetical protein [unclassified Mesorhizobium]TPJ88142.1 hypothetical protein FJ434_11715 [Mesorhizobium sp. B2-5-13]TPK52337.1 hypothetical protein FJ560_07130 [Mesorhizobium sp. B2-5-5]
MTKFREALERGKTAYHQQEQDANVPVTDFATKASAWLNDVVVASLEAAKAEVAGEMTIDIDTAPRRRGRVLTPAVRFQIFRKPGLKKTARRAFTVNVQLSGEVSVSSPGMVAEAVGNLGDRSGERFRNLVVKLIEDVARGV